MDWLEQNIDAYRIVSEILGQMRRGIREGLESVYGDTWYRDGLPDEVFQRLIAAKERERSIDWYEGQYQQIMDYAVFGDLIEILEKNAEHFPNLMALAPSGALLQARFLELDVMRAKLARARPISETELSFLGTFHLRFRKAFADAPPPAAASDSAPQDETPETEAAPPAPPRPDPKPRPAAPKVSPANPPAARPKMDSSRSVKAPAGKQEPAPSAPPKRPVRSAATPAGDAGMVDDEDTVAERRTIDDRDRDDEHSAESPAASEHAGDKETDSRVGPKRLAEALEGNDHRTVLRELYREVTAIAEGVWTSDVTPAPLVWEQVTASDWYEHNFSRLGLHPLSVFYEVTGNVEKMMRTGGTKKDLQELLKEMNFAKTLLALRDMFQANNL
ncbi:MAG TPA: hypothetical protein VLT81_13320 [Chondromyces sp.]|nr:hypothetical protein [Chondromyces sp.]